ncbi:type IV secretory system conjugative DNA transfer family protein [Paenibacillus abyssi]|uniref:type IV secretory system conjugative DNA transfer family protein n=1 Tax=Paenibacillus abyssi TaxID=1340531 RepID=UPI001E486711|nr:type IV secretory system conjugative DNA transfer family protein [Paenibacillus abyssi]
MTYISERGRRAVLVVTIIHMSLLYSGLFAWYINLFTRDFFSNMRVEDKPHLKITSMTGFVDFLMIIPVIICLIVAFYMAREFYKNEDFKKTFYKWEFSFLSNQSFSLRGKKCDVVVGWEKKTAKPIVLSEESRFLHELVVGATGSGKTSTAILIRIVQDLVRIARGHKVGVVVLEPKSDLIRDVQKLAEQLGIPKSKIKVVDPTDLLQSIKFNPLAGPLEVAAETWRGVLDALAGDQDPFFKGQQSETSAQYVMLGKIRYGNQFNFILHLQRMYSEPRFLADMTEDVRRWIERNLNNPLITPEERVLLDRYDRVCTYFENDVLEYVFAKDKEGGQLPVLYPQGHKYAGKQVVTNKKDKFIAGAKKYVTDISMNAMLSQLLVAAEGEETLDLDTFLNDGGILLFNTALAELEELSLMFGQFIIRQMQSAVFRRPPEEEGYKRIPVFFTIDEFPLYINDAFSRLLTLGRSYKVGTLIAIQNLGQLRVVQAGYDEVILTNASNKTVFGRGEVKDNEYFSKQFGEAYVMEESLNESVTPMSMPNQSRGLRYNTARKLEPRFTPTEIKEQPFKHFIVEVVGQDGSIAVPVQAYGKFVNETKFLKRFIDIGRIQLATQNHKPLTFKGNIHQLAYLVEQLDDKKKNDDAAPEVNSETAATDSQQNTALTAENHTATQQNGPVSPPAGAKEPPQAVPFPPNTEEKSESAAGTSSSAEDESFEWPAEDNDEPGSGDSEGPENLEEKREESSPSQTHSMPDNFDDLVKTVHDNLIGSPSAAPASSAPASGGDKAASQSKPRSDDLVDLDDLAAVDRRDSSTQQRYADEQINKVDDYKEDDI